VSGIRRTSIQVYAIGIGRINRRELQAIASDPDDEHVFILRSYLDAAGFVDFLSVTTCDSKWNYNLMTCRIVLKILIIELFFLCVPQKQKLK